WAGADGVFTLHTRGRLGGRRWQLSAPHITLGLGESDTNAGLNPRLYFDDEAQANAADPVINLIEWERRRDTLIARRTEQEGKPVYRFDIKLQGEGETVFFDI
ncbi:MAG: protocatechuate 3,4-dioxygenase subunit alpha, partial [Paracoccaceae bacterium]